MLSFLSYQDGSILLHDPSDFLRGGIDGNMFFGSIIKNLVPHFEERGSDLF